MTEKYLRECIEAVAFEQFQPVKLHEIVMLSSNPLDIANQLKSLRTFKGNSEVFGRDLWYKVNDHDAVKARAERTVKTFEHQLPLADAPDQRYPYHEVPVAVHGSVCDFYKAVGYDHKAQQFVGIGNVK